MANYESTIGCFPPGEIIGAKEWAYPATTWSVFLYPYLEQGNVYHAFNFNHPGTDPALLGFVLFAPENSVNPGAPCSVVVSTMLCPSDGMGGQVHHNPYVSGSTFARGNYLGFFGNLDYGHMVYNEPGNLDAIFTYNVGRKTADIKDGLSNTLAFGEYLTGLDMSGDSRGVPWYIMIGSSQIYTTNPPNSPIPTSILPLGVRILLISFR